ncbi:hypothetical protein N8T08_001265 [Aspergillus melleus]|uniref:Uncharacterized protein n=1 Tax=Aspergillus melleus TaxID=138277 RepID=A0ACC3ANQ8_9EURO|nr:hypothetical protein N8T08_001265 [Aspergillus melleus]
MSSISLTGREGRQISIPSGLFINNQFVPSKQASVLEVQNPFSGETLGSISAAESADVDVAVDAASHAFQTWRYASASNRHALLNRLAGLIERDADEFAAIHALDGGFVYDDVKAFDISQACETLRYFANCTEIPGRVVDVPGGKGVVRKEPIGVCAAIVPWNAPLMITIWKLAAALAAGNTLIIKSPEAAPLFGQKLGQLIVEAKFPAGVVSILCGLGTVAGKAIAEHMRIRKIAFTGSTPTGRSILRASANSNLKRVSLELGGKSPSIVFNDANLDNALFWNLVGSSANNGQVCALGSRIYVQDGVYDRFVEGLVSRARQMPAVTGNPLQKGVTKGPVINKQQHNRILSYLEKGRQEGAKTVLGGTGTAQGSSGFVENTILTDVGEDFTIVKEEIFGPVATVHRFSTEDEVIAKANDSEYGLSAAIFTENVHRADRVANALESGQVTVNCWGMMTPSMPFGGVKQSGFGRDMGEEALEAWLSVKAIKYWSLNEKANL